jgi:hypothetical protein
MAQPTSDIGSVIRHEQDALATETRIAQCPPFVAVNNLDDVARLPTKLRWDHKATVETLAKARGGAFIVSCPSLNSAVLWVATDNNDYRKDYLNFLNVTYGLELSSIPTPYDVDHLYNRSRAQMYGLKFIRLALVGHSANRSHGAAYEKDITTNEALRVRRDMKLMDEITSMKYFGFLSPLRNDPRDQEISAYATFAAAKLGLHSQEVRNSVLYLREKASKPWAANK